VRIAGGRRCIGNNIGGIPIQFIIGRAKIKLAENAPPPPILSTMWVIQQGW